MQISNRLETYRSLPEWPEPVRESLPQQYKDDVTFLLHKVRKLQADNAQFRNMFSKQQESATSDMHRSVKRRSTRTTNNLPQ